MDKKTLALWAAMATASLAGKAKTSENPANFEANKNSIETVIKSAENNDKTYNFAEFLADEVKRVVAQEQQIDTLGGSKPHPVGFVKELILDNENIPHKVNSAEKNAEIADESEITIQKLRGKVATLEKRMASLENNKLELAREYFAEKGKFDLGDDKAWEKFQKEHPKTVRKIIDKIEKKSRNYELNKGIQGNDVEDYEEIRNELDKFRKILKTMEDINLLYSVRHTVDDITLDDIKRRSDLLKAYNKAVEDIFNLSEEYLVDVYNYEMFNDLEKGINKMKKVQQIIKINDKLSELEVISHENNVEIQSAINILGEIRELRAGGVMDIKVGGENFEDILKSLSKFAGLVGLDEDRQKIKNYLEILEKNNYPDKFSVFNLKDNLEYPDSRAKNILGNLLNTLSSDTSVSLDILITELSKSLDNHVKFQNNKTKINITETETQEANEIIYRYRQLESLKGLYDKWESLTDKQQIQKYEYFSQVFESTIANHYLQNENPAKNKENLKKDLESLGKKFWKSVYWAMVHSGYSKSHTGKMYFGGVINVHQNGEIEIKVDKTTE